jgi:hypothetical protein
MEFSPTPTNEEMQNWQHQNDTDFAWLKGALGIPSSRCERPLPTFSVTQLRILAQADEVID